MSSKKPFLEVAAAVAEASKKVGDFYIFSSLDRRILKEENASAIISTNKFSRYGCADCGTKFSALAGLESEPLSPYCMVCGSNQVKRLEEVKAQKIHPDNQLVSNNCETCGSINVTHSDYIKAVKNANIHCVMCGTDMAHIQVQKADLADGDPEAKDTSEMADMSELDTDAVLSADSEDDPDLQTDSDGVFEDDGPEVEGKAEDSEEDTEEDASEKAEDDEKEEEGDAESEGGDDDLDLDELEESPVEGADDEDSDGEEKEEEQADGVDGDPGTNVSDLEDVNVADSVNDEDLDELALVKLENSFLLTAGSVCFAELKKEHAGENAELFDNPQFQSAILSSLHEDGIRQTMSAFNFSPVMLKVNLKKHVARKVTEAVATETSKLEQQRKDMIKAFRQAMDIAATGLNKGFWKDKTNPLKAAFVAELSGCGLRGAEKVVARIFEKQGLAYVATLMEQAKELLGKSPEMRNELASVLNMTGTVLSSDEGSEDDDDDEDVEEALSQPFKPLNQKEAAALAQNRSAAPRSAIRELAVDGGLFDA